MLALFSAPATPAAVAAWQQRMQWLLVVLLDGPALMLALLLGWLRAIGLGLLPRIGAAIRPRGRRVFRLALWLPPTYLLALVLGAAGMAATGQAPFAGRPLLGVLVLVPVHLLSMGCIFFCLYFAARVLRTAELQRPAGVAGFLGDFFLLWFAPLGIWLVQPRLKALAAQPATAAGWQPLTP